MQHWIIDSLSSPLPSWQSAFPDVSMCRPDEVGSLPGTTPAVIWCRLRQGAVLEDALRGICAGPGQFMVVLADDPDDGLVSASIEAGAAGCCNTHAAPEVLRQVALVVSNGGLWVGQSLLRRLISSTARVLADQSSDVKDDWRGRLSDRELQVADLIGTGASNKEIARQLSITERTVKAHLTAVFDKLGVRDRLQLSLKINGLNI